MEKTVIASSATLVSPDAFYTTDKYEKKQWYLDGSTMDSSLSIDVFSVWADYTGKGVKVGVIDSQIDFRHSDLKGAYDTSLDYNFALGTGNVSIDPANLPHLHGTAVAGIISAEGDNLVGTVGIASGATLVGYGIDYNKSTAVSDILAALDRSAELDVVNNSWSFSSNFADDFGRNPEYGAALLNPVMNGRDGLGTSLVFAAGNVGTGGSSNYHNFQNSPYTIAVGAVDPNGAASSFTSVGANVLISAAGRDVFTTTLNERWDHFNGTSFAAPAVSAAIALMLEANPELGYRDVQEILAYSARREGLSDTVTFNDGWTTNGATNFNGGGLHFSDAFGYGFLNVHDAVRLAETWTDQQTYANLASVSKTVTTNKTLVAGKTDMIAVDLVIDKAMSVEHVQLSMDLRWTETGNLDVYLVSPEGTKVRLMYDLPGTDRVGNVRDFTFSSVASMGEMAKGTWTLEIHNRNPDAVLKSGDPMSGTLSDVTLTVLGNATDLDDDTYVYTDELGLLYDGADLAERSVLRDTDGGTDTLNAAAITSGSTIDLSGKSATKLAGVTIAMDASIENAFTGDGNDTVRGSNAANVIGTGRGNDTIYFSFGNDVLDGGAGQDTLVIDATLGSLTGGLAADGTLHISARAGEVTSVANVETFVLANGIYSFAQLSAALGDAPVDAPVDTVPVDTVPVDGTPDALAPADPAPEAPAPEEPVAEEPVANEPAATPPADEGRADYATYLTGTNGDDSLEGGEGADHISGGAGNDRLEGNAGADMLLGGAGNDVLKGSDGNDWLYGGEGSDRLYGGDGADTFVLDFADIGNIDTIFDFDTAEGDRILLTGVGADDMSGAEFTLTEAGTTMILQMTLNGSTHDVVRLRGYGELDLSMAETDLGLLCA